MWQYNHTPSSDELYHYGVKGMKWKKRKKAAISTGKAILDAGMNTIKSKAYKANSKRLKKKETNAVNRYAKSRSLKNDVEVVKAGGRRAANYGKGVASAVKAEVAKKKLKRTAKKVKKKATSSVKRAVKKMKK